MDMSAQYRRPASECLLLLLIILFVACTSDSGGTSIPFGGQTGSEVPPCEPVKTSELEVDERSPLGFSPKEILEYSEGDHFAEFKWASGEVTTLEAEVTLTGPIRYEDLEPGPSTTEGPAVEIEVLCEDGVLIPVRFRVSSDDGRLEDVIDGTLKVTSKEEAELFARLNQQGTLDFEVTEIDLEDYSGITFFIEASFGPSHFKGEVFGQATRMEVDKTVVSATRIEVATWGSREPDI